MCSSHALCFTKNKIKSIITMRFIVIIMMVKIGSVLHSSISYNVTSVQFDKFFISSFLLRQSPCGIKISIFLTCLRKAKIINMHHYIWFLFINFKKEIKIIIKLITTNHTMPPNKEKSLRQKKY